MVQWFSGLMDLGLFMSYVEGRGASAVLTGEEGAVVGLVGWSDVRVFGCSRAWFGLVLLPWVIYIYIYFYILCVGGWGLWAGKSIRVFSSKHLVLSSAYLGIRTA